MNIDSLVVQVSKCNKYKFKYDHFWILIRLQKIQKSQKIQTKIINFLTIDLSWMFSIKILGPV